jgi:uncharacterized protein
MRHAVLRGHGLDTGAYSLDCDEDDLPRIRELASRYESLPLGFSDAAVIACAERGGGRVPGVGTLASG